MAINVTCPHCHATSSVPDNYAGQTMPCKSCGQMTSVPMGMSSGNVVAAGAAGTSVVIIVLVVLLVMAVGCGGVAVALLLPAVSAARQAARRVNSANNMKQIMLAIHNYHDTYHALPPAYTTDANGKPLLSWRVLLLPYLEGQQHYSQFDLNQPWDSLRNRAIAEQMPPVFRSPLDAAGTNSLFTSYLFVTGTGTAFDGGKQASFANIPDGTSNTIACVEVANSGVLWTQPSDLDVAQLDFVIHGLKDARPGQINAPTEQGTNVGFFDGSVRFLSRSIDPASLRAAAGASDGLRVDLP